MLRSLFALFLFSASSFAQAPTTPADHLGREVGGDFSLADWDEVSGYYRRLASESDRVLVERIGATTEGRDFLLAVVSDPANLARLDDLRERSRRLADPAGLDAEAREELIAGSKPIVFISLGMHSTETSPPQFGMELVHALATSDEEPFVSARRELVVVIAPCLNPDGLDHVVEWYRENVGTPHETSSLPELYQRYAGHDNNRDWFALALAETRLVTRELYHRWFPQVYWDVHEQGQSRERFFVPPFRDPLDPNVSPRVVVGMDELGTRALFDMTRAGLTGIATGVTYDMWWNGGNRNVPARHRIIGLLTEAAGVDFASPIFLSRSDLQAPRGLGAYAPSNRFPAPWPGGWWRMRDILEYEHAFARSLLGSLAREPRVWLENALLAAEEDLAKAKAGAPRAWVLPSTNRDRGAVERLVDVLTLAGVRVFAARSEFEVDGRHWPAGSLVLPREQPYGEYLKDLMEVQVYPEGDDPYDVSGWTLPLLFGVERAATVAVPDVELDRVLDSSNATAKFPPRDLAENERDVRDSHAWRAAIAHLSEGGSVRLGTDEDEGKLLLGGEPEVGLTRSGLPRVGVLAPWSGLMNEGWLRWMFESFGFETIPCRYEMLRAGGLATFLDVLVVPSLSADSLVGGRGLGTVAPEYVGGLGADGTAAIVDFVRGGGTLVTLERSSAWAIDLFGFDVDVVTEGDDEAENEAADDDAEPFSCPGSVLRTELARNATLTAGLAPTQYVFFANSLAFRNRGEEEADALKRVQTFLRYAESETLASGWIAGAETIEGAGAWCRGRVPGGGHVHLFGFRPQYRGWSQSAFLLLLRAILFGS